MSKGLISEKRFGFHTSLLKSGLLTIKPKANKHGVPYVATNADKDNKSSVLLANGIFQQLLDERSMKIEQCLEEKHAQGKGNSFEAAVRTFIESTFEALNYIRPGTWNVRQITSRGGVEVGGFEQYTHLRELQELSNQHLELRSFLGDGYTISPDVVITRKPEPDVFFNTDTHLLDNESANFASLRLKNHPTPPLEILHASISCKFTMRSDRAQNTRTEALNLLRSRKGRSPHIVSVTAEPTPSRISSLALGTGDLDCVYHFALPELIHAAKSNRMDDSLDFIDMMVKGKRLKDISDLPLDLVI